MTVFAPKDSFSNWLHISPALLPFTSKPWMGTRLSCLSTRRQCKSWGHSREGLEEHSFLGFHFVRTGLGKESLSHPPPPEMGQQTGMEDPQR